MGSCSSAHGSNEMVLYQLCTLILILSDEAPVVDPRPIPHLMLSQNDHQAQTNDLSFPYLLVHSIRLPDES